MQYTSNSPEETQDIAKKIAQLYKNRGGIIALIGDLAAGKTTFTQGFAEELGVKEKVISPTFIITRQHQIEKEKRILFHLDLYRLNEISNIEELGILDMIVNSNNIIIIEWAEKIIDLFPKGTLIINFEKTSETSRNISLATI